ncbi:hypothetical protein N657DRAFT_460299 [Parathielavia appendiculata]|uniref:Uncharacterized protein n=1 Tax=Parathielavia appendiculata TaxID=2587402 RepID=A0AAN6U125_9PEZI|nr:hypothetical protein N657DRAFT_460299 [Parathielavia appendiculata]
MAWRVLEFYFLYCTPRCSRAQVLLLQLKVENWKLHGQQLSLATNPGLAIRWLSRLGHFGNNMAELSLRPVSYQFQAGIQSPSTKVQVSSLRVPTSHDIALRKGFVLSGQQMGSTNPGVLQSPNPIPTLTVYLFVSVAHGWALPYVCACCRKHKDDWKGGKAFGRSGQEVSIWNDYIRAEL